MCRYTIIRHVQETSEILSLSTVFLQPVELVTTCTLTMLGALEVELLRPINCQTYITLDYITLHYISTVVTAKCACIRNTNVRFCNVCMQIKL